MNNKEYGIRVLWMLILCAYIVLGIPLAIIDIVVPTTTLSIMGAGTVLISVLMILYVSILNAGVQ